MPTFNLKDYKKIDGDEHINLRLEREEHIYDSPDTVTEDLLESGRVDEKEVTTEKQLEKSRTGGAEIILERNLDTAESNYGIKHRNPEAYEGSMGKIEELRRSPQTDPIEEEEPNEPASETPKDKRWWEVKSPDGLKIAQKLSTAGIWGDEFEGNEFSGFMDEEDNELDELDEELDNEQMEDFLNAVPSYVSEGNMNDFYNETFFDVDDSSGTPTAVGKIQFDPNSYTPVSLESELEMFLSNEHPELPFSMDSFDLSQLRQGTITYMIGMGSEGAEVSDVGNLEDVEDFDIIDASGDFTIIESSKKK